MKNNPPYTTEETEYLLRVSGKVPVEIIARQLKRTKCSVMHYAAKQGISVLVPKPLLLKNYPEVVEMRRKMREKNATKRQHNIPRL